MFISNLKSILSSLKTESFLDSSLWCQFREIQIQMIHRVISITSKDDENEELLSKLEKDSEVIDKIIAEIDQRWKMELDHSFIREVSYWDKRLFWALLITWSCLKLEVLMKPYTRLITGVRRPCQIKNVKPYLDLVHTCIKTALIIRKGTILNTNLWQLLLYSRNNFWKTNWPRRNFQIHSPIRSPRKPVFHIWNEYVAWSCSTIECHVLTHDCSREKDLEETSIEIDSSTKVYNQCTIEYKYELEKN